MKESQPWAPRHNAEDMVYDPRRNSIWINSGDGLLEFSLDDKQFRPIEALKEVDQTKKLRSRCGS